MGWVQFVPSHTHDYPRHADEENVAGFGSVWKCECGKQFRVTGLKLGASGLIYRWEELS